MINLIVIGCTKCRTVAVTIGTGGRGKLIINNKIIIKKDNNNNPSISCKYYSFCWSRVSLLFQFTPVLASGGRHLY